jgi:hypothetical protein
MDIVGMGGLNFSKKYFMNFLVMAHENWKDIWWAKSFLCYLV